MPSRRREFLLAVGGLAAGGAVTGRAGGQEVATPGRTLVDSSSETERSTDTQRQIREIDTEFRLSADEHRSFQFSFDAPTALLVDLVVRWGPGVDVITFASAEEYRAYLNDYRARYRSGGTFFSTVNIPPTTVDFASGEYVLVVDNTGWSRGLPGMSEGTDGGDRPVGVDLELTASR